MHAIPQCSEVIDIESEGYGEERLCLSCKQSTDEIASIRHEENWRGLNDNAFLKPNDLYLDNEFLFHEKLLAVPILKNRSVMKLKPIKIHDKKLTLNNTCPFDSLFQLILGTYVDRDLFRAQIDILATENRFFELIGIAAERGITIYRGRLQK